MVCIGWRNMRKVGDEEGKIKSVNIEFYRRVCEGDGENRSWKGYKSG